MGPNDNNGRLNFVLKNFNRDYHQKKNEDIKYYYRYKLCKKCGKMKKNNVIYVYDDKVYRYY